jgi:hypothetical protein
VDFSEWSSEITAGSGLPGPKEMPVTATIKPKTDFYSAPGFREVTVEYTCIPDPMYPWDPKVLQAIWEFAPDTVPMWVHWVFRTPEVEQNPHNVVFGRHALGRVIKPARTGLTPFRCAMPTMPCQGLTFEKPNAIWFIHQGDSPSDEYVDLPGEYLPFDMEMKRKAYDSWAGADNLTEEEWKAVLRKEMIEDPMEATEKRAAEREAEREERNRDFAEYAKKVIPTISDSEIEAYQAHWRRLAAKSGVSVR